MFFSCSVRPRVLAGEYWPGEDREEDKDEFKAGAEDDGCDEGDEEEGCGVYEVDDSHCEFVPYAAGHTRCNADSTSDDATADDDDECDRERYAGAVDDAAQKVASDFVGPKNIIPRATFQPHRWRGEFFEFAFERVVGCDPRREDGHNREADGDDYG